MRRSLGVVVVLAAVTVTACAKHATVSAPPPTPKPAPTKPPILSFLNGTEVSAAARKHRIAAVMIDNYPIDARPQSGLRDADIVYEAEAEGGITRYMALFLEKMPQKIGPVRSARTYFVDLARPYDPLFAHAGGNDDVWGPLKELRLGGFADMDEIVGTPEAFWRDHTRYMPHNLYTSVARLRKTAAEYSYPDRQLLAQEFVFNADPPPRPRSSEASFSFWNHYSVQFELHGHTYERLIGGQPQHDLEDPTPYRVADIIAVWIPARVLDELGDLEMEVYGTFPAVLIRDGFATPGRWVAPGPNDLPELLDLHGANMELNPGQIYIEVLPQGGTVRNGKNIWSY